MDEGSAGDAVIGFEVEQLDFAGDADERGAPANARDLAFGDGGTAGLKSRSFRPMKPRPDEAIWSRGIIAV